jgi:hypothetical protein
MEIPAQALPGFPQPPALAKTSSCVRNLSQRQRIVLQAFGSCAMCGSSFEFRVASAPARSAFDARLDAKSLDRTIKEKL